MPRKIRKSEHIKYSLELDDGPAKTLFNDITLTHNCLPEMSINDINLTNKMFGVLLDYPIFINAITGGNLEVKKYNEQLAILARENSLAMAVGSQYGAASKNINDDSFSIVRKVNPNGVIFSNIGANASIEIAKRAVNMIEAQALQIHLNPAQELIMSEGDKNFTGYLKNIEEIVLKIGVPVIVKETGCGISSFQAKQLNSIGVKYIDISGVGGTNFPLIELMRQKKSLDNSIAFWGIPTALSIIDAVKGAPDAKIIASGGIRTAQDVIKSIALGAELVGMSGNILKILSNNDINAANNFIHQILEEIKLYMILLGCKNINSLKNTPLLFSGKLYDFIKSRGYNLESLTIKNNNL